MPIDENEERELSKPSELNGTEPSEVNGEPNEFNGEPNEIRDEYHEPNEIRDEYHEPNEIRDEYHEPYKPRDEFHEPNEENNLDSEPNNDDYAPNSDERYADEGYSDDRYSDGERYADEGYSDGERYADEANYDGEGNPDEAYNNEANFNRENYDERYDSEANVNEPYESDAEKAVAKKEKAKKPTKEDKKRAKAIEKSKAKDEERGPKIKKKRGCFYHGCMTILVFNFIMVVAVVGVGLTLGNQYCKQKLDLSLGQVFGVVNGIFNSNDKFIDNPYGESDEQGFFDSLGGALMLKEGVVDKEEFKSIVVDSIASGGDGGAQPVAAVIDESDGNSEETEGSDGNSEGDGEITDGEEGEGDSAFMDGFGNYLAKVLKTENFDRAKIDSIGTPEQADTNLKITDKEIAAAVNGLVGAVADGMAGDIIESAGLKQFGIEAEDLHVKDYVKMNQLKLNVKNYDIGGKATNVNTATVTVSVALGKMLGDVKKAIELGSVLPSSVSQYGSAINTAARGALGVVKMILPDVFYLTLEMGISHDIEPKVYINNMGFGDDRMDNLFKLTAKYGESLGGELDLKKTIDDMFLSEGGAVKGALDGLRNAVDVSKIFVEGGIDCDIYQFALDMAGVNDGLSESERVTTNDLLGVMKILFQDNTAYLDALKSEEYNYKNVQFKHDELGKLVFNEDGEPIIENQGKQYYVTSGEELDELLDDYEHILIRKFTDGFGLKSGISVDDIVSVFSTSPFDEDAALELFDAELIKEIINDGAKGIVLDDKSLGAMFMKMLPKLLSGENSNMPDDFVGVEYIYIEEKDVTPAHYFLNVGLNLNVYALLDGNNLSPLIKNIVKGLLSEKLIMEAGVDITLDAGAEDNPYLPSTIKINGNKLDAINKLLRAFNVFGDDENGNRLSLDDFLESNVLSIVRNTISNMSDTLPGLEIQASGIKLPNVFSAIAHVINMGKSPDDPDYVHEEHIRPALKTLSSEPFTNPESAYAFYAPENKQNVETYNKNCEDALLNELADKYAISTYDEASGSTLSLGEVLYVLGVGGELKDPSKVEGKEIYDIIVPEQLEKLADDDEMTPVLVSNTTYVEDKSAKDMFSALIRAVAFSGNTDFGVLGDDFGEDDLLFAKLSKEGDRQFVSLTVKALIKNMLPDDFSGGSSRANDAKRDFINSLLPDSESIISLKIDITTLPVGEEHYPSEVLINDDEEGSDAILSILENLGMEIDFEALGESIRTTINELDNTIDVEFGDGLMTLPNVFASINDLVLGENKFQEDGDAKVKAALTSVYRTSNTPVSDGETQTKYQKFESELDSEKAKADCKEFLSQVSDKYFLDGAAKTAADNGSFDDLFNVIGADSLSADNIKISEKDGEPTDTKYLAYDIRGFIDENKFSGKEELTQDDIKDSLNPVIGAGDLGAIIASKNEDSQYTVHSIRFDCRKTEGSDEIEKHMILYATISIDSLFTGNSDDLSKLLTVDAVFAEIDVNMDNVKTDEVTNETYYDATITVNKMNDYENDSLMGVVKAFGSDSSDIDNLNVEVGKAIYDAFDVLNDSYGEDGYSLTEQGIVLRDIYTLFGKNIIKDTTKSYTGNEIKRAIQGMYNLPTVFYDNKDVVDKTFNYIDHATTEADEPANSIVKNPLIEFTIDKTNAGENLKKSGITIKDSQFGYYVNSNTVSEDAEGKGEEADGEQSTRPKKDGDIVQLNILASGTEGQHGENQKADRKWLTDLGIDKLTDEEPYILVTVKVKTTKLGEMQGNSASLVPEEMLLSFVMKHDHNTDQYEYSDMILNNMTKADEAVLIELTGIKDTSNQNLQDEAENYLDIINGSITDLKNALFNGSAADNIKTTFVDATDDSVKDEENKSPTVRGYIKFAPNGTQSLPSAS